MHKHLPDSQYEQSEFVNALASRAARAGTAFDARRRKLVPIVDATALKVCMPLMTSKIAADCSSPRDLDLISISRPLPPPPSSMQ